MSVSRAILFSFEAAVVASSLRRLCLKDWEPAAAAAAEDTCITQHYTLHTWHHELLALQDANPTTSPGFETFPPEFPQITSSFLFYLPHERRADFLQPDALFKFCDNKGSPNFLKRLPEVMLVKAAPDGESEAEAEPACQLTFCNCCLTLGESVQVVRFAARSLLLSLHSQHLSGFMLCLCFFFFHLQQTLNTGQHGQQVLIWRRNLRWHSKAPCLPLEIKKYSSRSGQADHHRILQTLCCFHRM